MMLSDKAQGYRVHNGVRKIGLPISKKIVNLELFASHRINSLGVKIVIVHSAGGTVNEGDELKCLFRGRISIPISTSST